VRRAWGSRSFALNFIQCGGSGKHPAAVVRLCSNWGAVCGWQQTQPAVDSALGTLPRLRPFLSGFPMPISNRLAFLRWPRSDGATSRTAVYGPVRTVVWQGSAGNRCPYADQIALALNERKPH
jgi:hypothetical protein